MARGLTVVDFLNKDGKTVTVFSLYLDAENKCKKFKYCYGISDSLELKLELPFLSWDGSFMDSSIESVNSMIGISNFKRGGAYRDLSEPNQYAYYVVQDGKFIFASTKQIYNVRRRIFRKKARI